MNAAFSDDPAAVEGTARRAPEDALRFLDVGQDVACSVTITAAGNLSTSLTPLGIGRVAGLRELLDQVQQDNDDVTVAGFDPVTRAGTVRDEPMLNPYRLRPIADWYAWTGPGSPAPVPLLTGNAGGSAVPLRAGADGGPARGGVRRAVARFRPRGR